MDLLAYLLKHYPKYVEKTYQIEIENKALHQVFDEIAKKRGFLMKGGEYDYRRTTNQILNDFKNGKIGRITIEQPM